MLKLNIFKTIKSNCPIDSLKFHLDIHFQNIILLFKQITNLKGWLYFSLFGKLLYTIAYLFLIPINYFIVRWHYVIVFECTKTWIEICIKRLLPVLVLHFTRQLVVYFQSHLKSWRDNIMVCPVQSYRSGHFLLQ